MSRWIRTVLVASSLSLALAPAASFADDTKPERPAAPQQDKGKGKWNGKGKRGEVPQFPMKAETFKDHVEHRIARARKHLDRILERREVPDDVRARIKKDFEAGATAVRAAANRVAADGQVTKEEAKEVKKLAKNLKKMAREKYGFGKKGKQANRGEAGRTATS